MKTYLITGVSSGIGLYLVKKLLSNKFKVIGISRKKPNIKNENFTHIKYDLKQKNFSKLFKILKKYKKIDYFINNAGYTKPGNKIDNSIYYTFDINFFSGLKLSLYLIKKNPRLNLVHMSSISGVRTMPKNIVYNSSKAALIMMSKSIASDFGKFGVKSNSIILGYFKTKMTKKTFANKKSLKEKINITMNGKIGNMEEIFKTVIFLTQDNMRNMTGHELYLDSGSVSKGL